MQSMTPGRPWLVCLPLAVLAVLLAVLGWALFDGRSAQRAAPAQVDRAFPDVSLATLMDAQQYLRREDLLGQPFLANIWATWCQACRIEHPYLNQLKTQGVRIIGINYLDQRDAALQWLAHSGDPYQLNLFDQQGELGLQLGVTGAPETYIVDHQGQVVYRHVGVVDAHIWQTQLAPIYNTLVSQARLR